MTTKNEINASDESRSIDGLVRRYEIHRKKGSFEWEEWCDGKDTEEKAKEILKDVKWQNQDETFRIVLIID